MTIEELQKVPFRMKAHLAMANGHTTIYASEDGQLGFYDITPKGRGNGKPYRRYRIGNVVFESRKAFLEALADYQPKAKEP